MAKFEAHHGFHVYGWMRLNLGLSGGELITYAIVWQFSQGNAGVYTGGIPYIADFLGCTRETARKYLHLLAEKKYIIPQDARQNGVPYVHYIADNQIPKKFGYIPKNLGGDTQNFEGGIPKKIGVEKNIEYKENNTPHFVPPTLEMVSAYAEIRRNEGNPPIDPQAFYNYNVASGWKVGSKSMKDWKAAFRTWEDKRRNDQKTTTNPTTSHRTITWSEIRK